jgi:hypothetical protein
VERTKVGGVGDNGGKLEVLATAGLCLLKGAAHCDDAVWPRHLHLEVGVVGGRHEIGVAQTPEDGVVRSLKIHHLED